MVGIFLLVCACFLPVLSILLALRLKGKLRVELSAGAYGEKGKEIEGKIRVYNRSFLPVQRILCEIICENLLTGEKETSILPMAAPVKKTVETDIRLRCMHAGRVRISMQKIYYYDLFGLAGFHLKPTGETSTLTLVSPHTFSMETQIAYGENANMDSDEFSMNKAGYDPSETFAIREYQPGDRIKQIHWKLSEKYDNLMVRDYGLPIQNTILLLLETGRPVGSQPVEPEYLDTLAEAILSLSQELLSQQVVHSIGWQNHEEGTFSCIELENEEDLNIALAEILGAVPGEDIMTAAEHYLEHHEQMEFAHVVLFTTRHHSNLSFLAGQCLLTEVICGEEAGYDQLDGMAVIGIHPDTAAESFAYVEI